MYIFMCVALLFTTCNAQEKSSTEEAVDVCISRNGYYRVQGSCDAYIECMDHHPYEMLCPDGLNYNPKTLWPIYPCSYPADVPCEDSSQLPKPTADCPRQHGFFPSPLTTANDCGKYRLCSEGHAYDMFCPPGLAFDVVRARCDWPDLVPGCNSTGFIGFTCPAAEYDTMGNALVSNYKYEGDCYMFYSCQSGLARLLSCDPGFAFDANLRRCVEEDRVQCSSGDKNGANDVENE